MFKIFDTLIPVVITDIFTSMINVVLKKDKELDKSVVRFKVMSGLTGIVGLIAIPTLFSIVTFGASSLTAIFGLGGKGVRSVGKLGDD